MTRRHWVVADIGSADIAVGDPREPESKKVYPLDPNSAGAQRDIHLARELGRVVDLHVAPMRKRSRPVGVHVAVRHDVDLEQFRRASRSSDGLVGRFPDMGVRYRFRGEFAAIGAERIREGEGLVRFIGHQPQESRNVAIVTGTRKQGFDMTGWVRDEDGHGVSTLGSRPTRTLPLWVELEDEQARDALLATKGALVTPQIQPTMGEMLSELGFESVHKVLSGQGDVRAFGDWECPVPDCPHCMETEALLTRVLGTTIMQIGMVLRADVVLCHDDGEPLRIGRSDGHFRRLASPSLFDWQPSVSRLDLRDAVFAGAGEGAGRQR